MKAGKITAKLRDAVPVRFMAGGEEQTRYKNIDIPDSLKELEIKNFRFDISTDDKITFQLFFADGVLPDVFPAGREKLTRAEKAAAKEAQVEETAKVVIIDTMVKMRQAIEGVSNVSVNIAEPVNAGQPDDMEVNFNVTGDERKALVMAVADVTGLEYEYKAAPTFAFMVGDYIISKTGRLTGKRDPELLAALAGRGFTAVTEDKYTA